MNTNNNLICPTDGVLINETKVRLVAGLVLLTAIAYGLTNWLGLPLLLVVDFGLRSFDRGRYSPFGHLADWLRKTLQLGYRPTAQAPKRFAARIGVAFGCLITVLHVTGSDTGLPTGILALFAALESLAGFCAGCYVYTFYVRLFSKVA